jgi:hypothetical protein
MDNTDLLSLATPAGSFGPVADVKGSPVSDEQLLANIAASAQFDVPLFKKIPAGVGKLVFVAGGPTLRAHMDAVRAHKAAGDFILTSNNTHDFLIDNGIRPDGCLVFDPKERVKDYIKKPIPECMYYVGVTCVPEVFRNLLLGNAHVTKVLVAYGLDTGEDLDLQMKLYPTAVGKDYLIGGTMTALRAIPFAAMFGKDSIDFYGFDSCFGDTPPIIREGEPNYHGIAALTKQVYEDAETKKRYVIDEPADGGFFYAYKKKRPADDMTVAEVGDRRFLTSPVLAHQAKQLLNWDDRMEGRVLVTVHGDSLSSYLLARHRAKKAAMRELVGDARWTPEYAALMRQLHEGAKFGIQGGAARNGMLTELTGRLAVGLYVQLWRPITVLDYGCGDGDFGRTLDALFGRAGVVVTNYDPFSGAEDVDPGAHDIVVCADVMEHVEEACVGNTLKYIAERMRVAGVFIIPTGPAKKVLADGRNAHITQRPAEWWRNQLQLHFHISEATLSVTTGMFVVEKKDAVELIQAERSKGNESSGSASGASASEVPTKLRKGA